MRLYKIEVTERPALTTPAGGNKHNPDGYAEQYPKGMEEEWVAHCLETWGSFRSFFLPRESKIYRSRSSARENQQIVEHWGGKARILVAEVGPWEDVKEAAQRRQDERDLARADRLREEALAIESHVAVRSI